MKFGVCSLVVGGTALALLAAWGSLRVIRRAPRSIEASVASAKAARPRAVENYGKLPLSFEVNQGQSDAQVKFLARGQGYTLLLNAQEAVLSLHKSEGRRLPKERTLGNPGPKLAAGHTEQFALLEDRSPRMAELSESQGGEGGANTVVQMRLVGSSSDARVKGEEELPGKSNYFIGNDPKKWWTNIATYAKVRVEDVYPGVDLVYYGNQGQLEYDFVVRPGADPSGIRLDLISAHSVAKIDAEGDLVVEVVGGEVRFHKPVIYQPATTDKRQGTTERALIAGGYKIDEQNEVAFAIGNYDRTKPLVIDPVLAYSTYLGGSSFNWGNAIAVDSSGNAYVAGGFNEPPDQCRLDCVPFPTTQGAFETSAPFGGHAFVAKINPEGAALVYSTWLGGNGTEEGYGIAVDSSGCAYVTGSTNSKNFPATANAFQTTSPDSNSSNNSSAFVTKLSADGSALVYSTYLGGSNAPVTSRGDWGQAIAIDSAGNAYVTGRAASTNFPASANAFQTTNHSVYTNAFVTKLNVDASAVLYSTYLGGSGGQDDLDSDFATAIALNDSGEAYVTGLTWSTDFPTTINSLQPADPGNRGSIEAFVTRISVDGSALVYSTYLGGTGGAAGRGLATDSSGSAFVAGGAGPGFPTTSNSFEGSPPGGVGGGFVTKLSPDGSKLIYSTYLAGTNGPGTASSIAVDSSGDAYVTGRTGSTDFPTANGIQPANGGQIDAVVTEFTPDGSGLVYSTYLGGSLNDVGLAIAVDGSGNAYVSGGTYSNNFPVDSPIQPVNIGFESVFISKIAPFALTVPDAP